MASMNEKIIYTERAIVRYKNNKLKQFLLKGKLKRLQKKQEKEWLAK